MLTCEIKDKFQKEIAYLYLIHDNAGYNLAGISICHGILTNLPQNKLKDFKWFFLGNNSKKLGIQNDYTVILDLDTNLKHFFKNGKEDFAKLYTENGESVNTYVTNENVESSNARRFILKYLKTFTFTGLSAFLIDLTILSSIFITIPTIINQSNLGIKINSYLSNLVSTPLDSKEINVSLLKDILYSSSFLNDKEKDYLWNSELINDLIPYYNNTNYSAIIALRHRDLEIKPYTALDNLIEKGSLGYYTFDNLLHIKGYETSNSFNDLNYKKTVAHEYLHLLQVADDLRLITEPLAEIMAHEYYLHSADSTYWYAYDDACIFLKELMEITGPEVILERVFKEDSTALEDAVKPYFSPQDYEAFISYLNKNPFYDGIDYQYLQSFLETLYQNKYHDNIYNNPIINAIYHKENYNRVYFSKLLSISNPSYYCVNVKDYSIDIIDAYNKGLVKFYKEIKLNEINPEKIGILKHEGLLQNSIKSLELIDPNYKKIIFPSLPTSNFENNIVYLIDNANIPHIRLVKDVIRLDYAKEVSKLLIPVSIQEFISNKNDPQYTYYSTSFNSIKGIDYDNLKLTYRNKVDSYKKIHIEEILNTQENDSPKLH